MALTLSETATGPDLPEKFSLGASTSIDLSKDFKKDDEETFKVVYTVDKETCEVSFTRYGVDQHSNAQKVQFVVYDRVSLFTCSNIKMEITETNYISINTLMWSFFPWDVTTKINKSFDAWGSVVHTTVHLYGNGSRWGLVVVESKKKRSEEEAEVATVAHYFVKSSETSFDRSSGTDIGLSVVAKIGVSNGKFDITVEGPEQHPVSALLYMFAEVNRTGIWKPTMCPHCHHKRRGKMFWQSDSEDSDCVSIPLVPPPKMQEGSPMVEGSRETEHLQAALYTLSVIEVAAVFDKGLQ
ncbi:hypothetical protein ACSQ67_009472 [Phaseolus vulgaris]